MLRLSHVRVRTPITSLGRLPLGHDTPKSNLVVFFVILFLTGGSALTGQRGVDFLYHRGHVGFVATHVATAGACPTRFGRHHLSKMREESFTATANVHAVIHNLVKLVAGSLHSIYGLLVSCFF
jgi:hypothetical protein